MCESELLGHDHLTIDGRLTRILAPDGRVVGSLERRPAIRIRGRERVFYGPPRVFGGATGPTWSLRQDGTVWRLADEDVLIGMVKWHVIRLGPGTSDGLAVGVLKRQRTGRRWRLGYKEIWHIDDPSSSATVASVCRRAVRDDWRSREVWELDFHSPVDASFRILSLAAAVVVAAWWVHGIDD